MLLRTLIALCLCISSIPNCFGVNSFHAPSASPGVLSIRLHPADGVLPGTPIVASFGVPFPRGSLKVEDLSTIRLLEDGEERPALVEMLSPWRHRYSNSLDGASVRVVLVQVEVVFPQNLEPLDLTLDWLIAPRTRHRSERAARESTWQRVQSGSFNTSDNVFEPKVLAELPAAWLSMGALRGSRALPFDPSNTSARDPAQYIASLPSWPGTQEAERSHKNNFYTVLNEDSVGVSSCAYKTDREPWLYDRTATMFNLYFRSGSVKALREAIRSADFYRGRISQAGFFSLAASDTKYSTNEALAYAFWLTGDTSFLPAISNVASAHAGNQHSWSPSLRFWTERMVAFKLLALLIDYEVSGSPTRKSSINEMIDALAVHQQGASVPVPVSGRVDGAWYHTGSQHDASEMPSSLYGASSWMTALIVESLRRAYVTGEDLATAKMIRRSGNFLLSTLRVQAGGYNGAITTAPRYIQSWDGQDFSPEARVVPPEHSEEHALDVAAAIAWADYFGAAIDNRDPRLASAVVALYRTYDIGASFWVRPGSASSGRAEFRVSPCRKWGWEHKYSDSLSWALEAVQAIGGESIFQDGFEPVRPLQLARPLALK